MQYSTHTFLKVQVLLSFPLITTIAIRFSGQYCTCNPPICLPVNQRGSGATMQGFNMGRYRAPDADPRHESFNNGRHALGKRARHLASSGILIVRFELPFHVWCLSCNAHIPQGRRFNAEKQQAGHYLTTPIWSFSCKCHTCAARFEIHTDPEHAQYIVAHGVRKQNQQWDPAQHGGHAIYDSQANTTQANDAHDAFSALESQEKLKSRAKARQARFEQLESHSHRTWADPYTLNASLRTKLRNQKKSASHQLQLDLQLKDRIGWHHDQLLLSPTPSLTADKEQEEQQCKQWRDQQSSRSIKPTTSNQSKRSSVQRPPKSTPTPREHLQIQLLDKSRRKRDPFLQPR